MRKSTFVKTSNEILKGVNILSGLAQRIADEDRASKVASFAEKLGDDVRGLMERSEAVFGKSGRKEMSVDLSLKTMKFLVTKHDLTVRAIHRAIDIIKAEEARQTPAEPDGKSPVAGRPQVTLSSGKVLTLKQ